MEPSVDKLSSSRSVTTKTKPRAGRKSLGDDTGRSRAKTDRPRSSSAEAGRRRVQAAEVVGGRVSGLGRPLVDGVKAGQIKAASRAIRDKENGLQDPMKITVMKIKKDKQRPLKVKVPSDVGGITDKPFQSNVFCESKNSKDQSTGALIVSGIQAKIPDSGTKGDSCDPEVVQWIRCLNLKDPERYIQLFGEQEIDMESLRLITEKHLKAIGITAVGPLNKLMQGIRNLRGDTFERYLQQFDTSRSLGPDKDLKHVEEREISVRGKAKKGRLPSDRSETASPEGENVEKKGDSLDMIPVKEPKKEKHLRKSSFQSKETISFEQKKREKILEVKKTAREKMVTHKKAEKEKLLKKKTGVPIQNQDFEGDTAVGLYGQDVSSAEPTPRTPSAEPVGSVSRNPWTSSGRIATEDDPLMQSIESKVRDLKLQGKANEAVTKDLIEKLQNQLKAIQVQTSENPGGDGVELGRRDSRVYDKSRYSRTPQPSEASQPFLSTRTSPPRPKTSLLASMSKNELITEVRKQKQEYNKQLKHLESELGRLKQTDPVKSCELPVEDVDFDEEELIGEGAFSKVYRGTFQGVEVAIKRLTVPLDRQDRNYFAAEVSLLRELRHPHVVLLVGVCTTTSLPLMVLEYMAGGSLYSAIHDPGTPSFDHVAYHNIAKDIALGMNYLHRHRPAILHLDLKSMNVLLSVHERAKIADFGFSKLRHEADMFASRQGRSRNTVRGTPAWMAPEMLSGGEVTIKADVYSFGVILWEMFSKQHPYDGCSTFQVLECLRTNKRPVIPQDCPETLAELISCCWNHNPARRLQFKDILIKLEDLAFPPEWRSLFDAANVPKLVLEDIESAREIVGFVNQTLERDIESLQASGDGPVADVKVPLLDLKLIDLEDDEEDENGSAEQTPETGADAASLDSWETEGSDGITPQSEQEVKSIDSWDSDLSKDEASQGVGPPIPVPPALPSIGLPPKPVAAERRDIQPLTAFKAPQGDMEPAVHLRAEDLVAQRRVLRSTSNQHPNQLKDLKDVPAETLTSIAMILREAVDKRRLAMKEGPSTDRSGEGTERGAWSTAESSRPDTHRIEES